MARGQSLYDWCMENGEYGQQLLFEFGNGNNSQQFTDEDGNIKTPHDFTRASGKKIPWKCKNNHEFIQSIHHRGIGRGCPTCATNTASERMLCAKLKVGDNDLYTWCLENKDIGDILITEFDYTRNKDIKEYTYGSHQKIWWMCTNCKNNYQTSVLSRTSCKSGCPECANIRRSVSGAQAKTVYTKNDLFTWCNNNGSFGEEILKQWTGTEIINGAIHTGVSTTEVSNGSYRKFMWRCSDGHEWEQYIFIRTHNRTGCPYCMRSSTSYPEQLLYRALKQIYNTTTSRCKLHGYEFDVGIIEKDVYIEYSPTYWHENRLDKDKEKIDLCNKIGVRCIYIHEDSKNEYEHCFETNYICYKASTNKEYHNKQLAEILDFILQSLGHSISEIDIEKAQTEAFNFMHNIESDTENTEVDSLSTPVIQIKPEDF